MYVHVYMTCKHMHMRTLPTQISIAIPEPSPSQTNTRGLSFTTMLIYSQQLQQFIVPPTRTTAVVIACDKQAAVDITHASWH